MQVYGYCPMIPFKPVIEPDHPGAFLAENPIISIHKGNIADIPWMTGVTSEEGTLKVAGETQLSFKSFMFLTLTLKWIFFGYVKFQNVRQALRKLYKYEYQWRKLFVRVMLPGIYGRDQGKHVRKLESEFMEIAPLSLMYEERYNISDKTLRDAITKSIREHYFGHDAIDESDESRFKVIKVK